MLNGEEKFCGGKGTLELASVWLQLKKLLLLLILLLSKNFVLPGPIVTKLGMVDYVGDPYSDASFG